MPRFRIVKKGAPTPPVPPVFALGMNIGEIYYAYDNVVFSDHRHGDLWQTMPAGTNVPAANLNTAGWPTTLPSGQTAWRCVVQNPEPVAGSPPLMKLVCTPGALANLTANGATLSSVNLAAGTADITPSGSQPGGGAFNLDFTLTSSGALAAMSVKVAGDASTFFASFLAQIAAQTAAGSYLRPLLHTWNIENFGNTAAWGGGTQGSPTRFVSLATRNALTSGEWSRHGSGGTRKGDGTPFELIVSMANACSRNLWHNFNANITDDLIDFYADYAADNLTGDYAPEVENEVWNFPNYKAQCAAEATVLGLPGPGERHIQRSLEIFARMEARFTLKGKLSKFKPVFAWQNAAGGSVAAYLLDYAPSGFTALKNHITYFATAPYFGNTFGQPDSTSTDLFQWWWWGWRESDAANDFAVDVQAACTARSVLYAEYERSQSYITSDATTNTTIQQHDLLRALESYDLDQAKARLGNVPANSYNNVAPISAPFGSWGRQTASMYNADTASPAQPKAKADRNFVSGIKTLTALQADLYFVVGDPNGTSTGILRVGRSYGSALALSNANFAINSSTGDVTIANSGALSSGANSVDFTETLAGYTGSPKTTTLNIQGYTLSAELLTNGNMASAGPPPTLYTGTTIGGGVATAASATQMVSWSGVCTIGQRYRLTFDYNRTGGQDIRITNSTTVATLVVKTVPLSSGAHSVSVDFVAQGTVLMIEATGAVYSGTLDNVSLKRLV